MSFDVTCVFTKKFMNFEQTEQNY